MASVGLRKRSLVFKSEGDDGSVGQVRLRPSSRGLRVDFSSLGRHCTSGVHCTCQLVKISGT